ncbi:MAG: precorrin-6A reductase [Lachnospiraceae bacterium]|nr:precorrin-6A reductase [Lachnospiraceae bacterium]
MKKIIIFGGTTEGRLLSDMLLAAGLIHTVSVATQYGREMLEENERRRLIIGRMDADQMCAFLQEEGFGAEDVCVDATHPYAVEVSANIKKAAGNTPCRYIRVSRDEEAPDVSADLVSVFDDLEKCCSALKDTQGNILLTTGSKELKEYIRYMGADALKRTYIRVLPSAESIRICEDEGVESKHIIAAHGPFSREFNLAMIRQYDIKHLVTKESGSRGGFDEKTLACADAQIKAYVIKRPDDIPGVDIYEAFRILSGREYEAVKKEDTSVNKDRHKTGDDVKRQITLAGCGMGVQAVYTCELKELIDNADALFGAARLIKDINRADKYAMYRADDISQVLDKNPSYRNVCVLYSGDSGFYSGAASANAYFEKKYPDAEIRILPGISSVSFLSALSGYSYDDAAIVSIHGHNSPADIHILSEKIRYNIKTFVLLSGDDDVRMLAQSLKDKGIDARIMIASDLSYEDQKLVALSVDEACEYHSDAILTSLVINDGCERKALFTPLKDEDFIRDKVPMTKECIRHEAIVRLKLKQGDVVYDIGGGTGSVAIEAALADPSLKVYTIEKKAEAAELIEKNIIKHHACNVKLIQGNAPETLSELEAPDCVFIGGSSGALEEILDAIHTKKTGVRYVISAVSLETISEIRALMDREDIMDASCIQLQVNEIYKAGTYHLPKANNPVMLFSFTR